MENDTLHLECPACDETFPVSVYSSLNEGIDFSIDDAPLCVLDEVNQLSNNKEIICPVCGCDVHLCIRFIAYPKPLSTKWKRRWRMI